MQVTITKIYKSNKNKDGEFLLNRNGENYTKLSIKTTEHGEKWLSGFQNDTNKDWKEGDVVEIEITENGEYLNFKTIDNLKENRIIESLSKRVEDLEIKMKGFAMKFEELKSDLVLEVTGKLQTDKDYNQMSEDDKRFADFTKKEEGAISEEDAPF